jgi:hypothetical protein
VWFPGRREDREVDTTSSNKTLVTRNPRTHASRMFKYVFMMEVVG